MDDGRESEREGRDGVGDGETEEIDSDRERETEEIARGMYSFRSSSVLYNHKKGP